MQRPMDVPGCRNAAVEQYASCHPGFLAGPRWTDGCPEQCEVPWLVVRSSRSWPHLAGRETTWRSLAAWDELPGEIVGRGAVGKPGS